MAKSLNETFGGDVDSLTLWDLFAMAYLAGGGHYGHAAAAADFLVRKRRDREDAVENPEKASPASRIGFLASETDDSST